MERQKALADARGNIAAPRPIQSWTQGAAQLAQAFFGARQEAGVADQLTQGRAKLAQLLSGIDPNSGATPEQQAQIYALDPDAGGRAMEGAAAMVRATRLREQTLADRSEGRTYAEGQTAATRAFETGQEATIDSREQAQAIEAEKRRAAADLATATGTETRQATRESAINERERLEAIEAEKRAATTYGPVLTGEAAAAVGLDPTKSYQLNQKTQQYDPVGGAGGITIQNVPPEAAGRLGLATNFLDQYDTIQAEVDAGNLTGMDYVSSVVLGRGAAGTAHRTIQSGSDSLLRNLTGAGMPASEAAKYVQRYEPAWTDDSATLHNKIEGLRTDLENVQAAVTLGRKWLPSDTSTATPARATATPDAKPADVPQAEWDVMTPEEKAAFQ